MKEEQQINKIRRIIEENKVGMMMTNLGKRPHNVFPMGTQQVDLNGDLWFFSSMVSDHFDDINADSKVLITYANENKQEYLSIYGDAKPIKDTEKIDELWNPMLNAWFDGKTDPNLIFLNVKIIKAKYWDSESNQMEPVLDNSKTDIKSENAVFW